MSSAIRVQLRCFSHVKHALGQDVVELHLPLDSTAADVECCVRAMLPQHLSSMVFRLALNHQVVDGSAAVHDGDEVALLPPMQGG